jgi:hypothetical protein
MLAAEAEGERESMLAAEAEGQSMLAAEAEGQSMQEGERESMQEGEDEEDEDEEDEYWDEAWDEDEDEEVVGKRRCHFRCCLCDWNHFSLTPRVAPGIDYDGGITGADVADYHPAWSLLLGVTDGASSLQLCSLRVARSGRILGRSDDVLEVFHKIAVGKRPDYNFDAGAVPLAPDGSSLLVLRNDLDEQPQALQLNLQPQADTKESPLPEIEGTTSDCMPISAGGHIWALSAAMKDVGIDMFSVVTRRFVPESAGGGRWELVGGPFTSALKHYRFGPEWGGGFLQGYAVLPDAKLILVSFQQYGLFLTFAPDSGRWTQVLTDTDEKRMKGYLPIFGRGIYVQQHEAVYMLSDNIIFAYKLTYQEDDQGTQRLKLDLPVQIDSVCPFIPEEGYGFLTSLDGCLMCSVWISLAWHDPCPCDNLHAIVTTFHLNAPAKGGIKVLHSTYRRIDMKPNPHADQKFCFLQ